MSKAQGTVKPIAKKLQPAIISPYSGRPLVEEFLGKPILDKLQAMVQKDSRLNDDMRFQVILRVLRRRHEIDNGSRTLSDVAADEANKILAEQAN